MKTILNSSLDNQKLINKLILENYCPSLTLTELHEKIQKVQYINIANISTRCKNLNLKLKDGRGGHNLKIKTVVKNPFELGNPNNEYWLGFLLADGNISKSSKLVSLFNTEVEFLRLFHNHTEFNCSEYFQKNKNKPLLRIYFNVNSIHSYLYSLGIRSDKRYESPLNFNFTWNIIRGLFDGDGFIRVRNYNSIEWKITSGNKNIISKLEEFFLKERVNYSIIPKGKAFDFYLKGTKKEKIDFLIKLYNNSTYFMSYKYKKIERIITAM